jgi:hypothetical protein
MRVRSPGSDMLTYNVDLFLSLNGARRLGATSRLDFAELAMVRNAVDGKNFLALVCTAPMHDGHTQEPDKAKDLDTKVIGIFGSTIRTVLLTASISITTKRVKPYSSLETFVPSTPYTHSNGHGIHTYRSVSITRRLTNQPACHYQFFIVIVHLYRLLRSSLHSQGAWFLFTAFEEPIARLAISEVHRKAVGLFYIARTTPQLAHHTSWKNRLNPLPPASLS